MLLLLLALLLLLLLLVVLLLFCWPTFVDKSSGAAALEPFKSSGAAAAGAAGRDGTNPATAGFARLGSPRLGSPTPPSPLSPRPPRPSPAAGSASPAAGRPLIPSGAPFTLSRGPDFFTDFFRVSGANFRGFFFARGKGKGNKGDLLTKPLLSA